MKGIKGELTSSINFDDGTLISPKFDLTDIIGSSVLIEVTLTLLFIEQSIAFCPYTTKCSPNKMTFAGADAIDFN